MFAKAPPQTEAARSPSLINGSLHIPAGAPDHRVDAEMTINQDVTLWSMLPHTHVRGKRWTYEVDLSRRPEGNDPLGAEVRLQLADRLRLQAAAEAAEGHEAPRDGVVRQLDDATSRTRTRRKDVWWGDQTWEEMMFTGLTYSIDPVAAAGAQ